MLQGLQLFQIVILFAGAILFLVLVFLLIWSVIKGKSVTTLIMCFVFPIVMIGWPSIKSFSYADGKIEIQTLSGALAANPADTTTKRKLEKAISNFDTSAASKDTVALNNLSAAYDALGDYNKATLYNRQALAINPNFHAAKDMQILIARHVDTRNTFNAKVTELAGNLKPLDNNQATATPTTTAKIVSILNATPQPVYTDAKSSLTIAKGMAVADQKEKSLQIINKVLEANPQSAEAIQLKKAVTADVYKPATVNVAQVEALQSKKFDPVVLKTQTTAKQ